MMPFLNGLKNQFLSFNDGFNRAINVASKFFLMAGDMFFLNSFFPWGWR